MDSQRSHGTAAASPASSDLSSANEDEAVSPVRSPTAVSRARKRRKVYPWPEEEAELYDELVASYGKGEKIDWQAVADELARKCSLAPAPARTAKACEGRVYNLSTSL